MAKAKKAKKASVKVQDLRAKADPKGGDGTVAAKPASTNLLKACATGEHNKEATITA